MTAAQIRVADSVEQKLAHRAPVRAWPLVAVVVGGVGGLVMSWSVAGHSLIGARWHFVVLIAVWVPAWVVAAWGARRLPVRWALVAVLVLAVLLRLVAASGTTASISNDAERYAWDAHVQLSGTDPYRYPPAAPQLDHLRTAGFWPDAASCHHLRAKSGCTVLNRPHVRTIYPAVAEAWFVAVDVTASLVTGHGFDGGGAGYRPWQLAGGLVDDLAIVLMILLLRSQGRDPRLVAWYALSPVAVIEFAGNGHVDGFSLALLLGAFLALRRGRPVLAGLLIGAATMVKLYPGAAVLAGWRQGRWRMLLPAMSVMVVSEAPHVAAVGTRVLGYLPGYLKEEHYGSGGRFLLLDILHLPARATIVLAVFALAAAMVAVLARRWSPEAGTAFVLVVLIGIATPVQPWYAVAIAGLALTAGLPCLILMPLLAEGYYASVVLDSHHQLIVGRLAYGLPLALVIALLAARAIGSRRRPANEELFDDPTFLRPALR
jgi:Glycosyltransferase family 87